VTYVVGSEYAEAVEAARYLAILPLVRGSHIFLADTLSGSGYHGVRTVAQVFVAGCNVVLNLLLIRSFSWKGAVWASLSADVILAVLLGTIVLTLKMRDRRKTVDVAIIHTAHATTH
jgi:O-antigen/teichoic acid export membrane protein